jgi:hypothetical protein
VSEKDLKQHLLSGRFLVSRAALARMAAEGVELGSVLAWFNGPHESVTTGDTREISPSLQAYFGFDPSLPNSTAFYVQIDVIPTTTKESEAMETVQQQQSQQAEGASLTDIFGPVISAYSRAQALADGELVDVTETAKEAGFKCPVAMTRAAWASAVEWSDEDTKRQVPQDERGRLWDVVWMCMQTAKRVPQDMQTFLFILYRVPRGGQAKQPKLTRLKATIGPGDNSEPVITIMEPSED